MQGIAHAGFLRAGFSFCHQTNSAKVVKERRVYGIIVYSSNCRYLRNQCTDIELHITSTSSLTMGNGNSNNSNGNGEGGGCCAGSASFRAHRTVVTCHSSWLGDQILNNGHWCVGDVVYLDEVCRRARMTAATFHTLLDFMYTGRTLLAVTTLSSSIYRPNYRLHTLLPVVTDCE